MPNRIVDILLVDDSRSDVELSLHYLKKCRLDKCVHVVRDGAEALEFLFCNGAYAGRHLDNVPKMILLDLRLPKVDGMEVLQQIKADPRTRKIPIVVLASSPLDYRIDECRQLGVDNYIVKPVDVEQFMTVTANLNMYWRQPDRPSGT